MCAPGADAIVKHWNALSFLFKDILRMYINNILDA